MLAKCSGGILKECRRNICVSVPTESFANLAENGSSSASSARAYINQLADVKTGVQACKGIGC